MNKLYENESFQSFTLNQIRPHHKQQSCLTINLCKNNKVELYNCKYYRIFKLVTAKCNFYFNFEDFLLLMYRIFEYKSKHFTFNLSSNNDKFSVQRYKTKYFVYIGTFKIAFKKFHARKILLLCTKKFLNWIIEQCQQSFILNPKQNIDTLHEILIENSLANKKQLRRGRSIKICFDDFFTCIQENSDKRFDEIVFKFNEDLLRYLIMYFTLL